MRYMPDRVIIRCSDDHIIRLPGRVWHDLSDVDHVKLVQPFRGCLENDRLLAYVLTNIDPFQMVLCPQVFTVKQLTIGSRRTEPQLQRLLDTAYCVSGAILHELTHIAHPGSESLLYHYFPP